MDKWKIYTLLAVLIILIASFFGYKNITADKSLLGSLNPDKYADNPELKSLAVKVKNGDGYSRELEIAVERLGEMDDVRAFEVLKAACGYHTNIYWKIVEGFVNFGKRDIQLPISALRHQNERIRKVAVVALWRLEDLRSADVLIEALKNSEGDGVDCDAADALGTLKLKSTVEPLIAALDSNEPAVAGSAAKALGKIGDKRAVAPILKTLKYKKGDYPESARSGAAQALGELGDKSAVGPLVEALKDSDGWVRCQAAKALGKLGDKQAVPSLVEALNGSNLLREEALEALGELKDASAISPLRKLLKSQMETTDLSCCSIGKTIAALGKIGDKKFTDDVILAAGKEGCVAEDAAKAIVNWMTFEELLGKLKSNDPKIRLGTVNILQVLKKQQAFKPLEELLNDNDIDVRRESIVALGVLHDKEAVALLLKFLNDPDERIRNNAICALGEIGDTRAEDPLLELINDKAVRGNVVWVLGQLKSRKSVPVLLELIKNDKEIQYSAAAALGNIGDQRAVEPLISIFNQNSKTQDNSFGNETIAEAIGKINSRESVEFLIGLLKNERENCYAIAALALGRWGDKRAVEPLIRILKNDCVVLNAEEVEIVRLLVELGDKRAIAPIKTIINNGGNYPLPCLDGKDHEYINVELKKLENKVKANAN
ncbi:MAG: hypothetical protein A2X48_11780 [Lentisphaerae bacterium GWF2_49_21]|nr:MAG: hypothetical protein A2X48_11780 [Lentisphaerae bacterium GWF2_49_21]